MYKQEQIELFKQLVEHAKRIVFFGGAGVSTESGIPDFRSQDGLYKQKYKYPPEQILSHTFFYEHTEEFYEFYRAKMLCLDAQPNAAHRKLAQWEQQGKLSSIITQNIDGLHQKAGSKKVCELHGSIWRNYCTECGKLYSVQSISESQGVPYCACGGIIKPDVVLYEESLDQQVLGQAVKELSCADLLIVGGTSLNVYPAASLVDFFRGRDIVVVNQGLPARGLQETIYLEGKIGEIFSQI